MKEQPGQYQEEQPRMQAQRDKEYASQRKRMMEKFGLGQVLRIGLPKVTYSGSQTQCAMRDGVPNEMIYVYAEAGEQRYPDILP